MISEKQLYDVFKRIGLEYYPDAKRDYDLLAKVQYAFQKTVPYENLDIIRGVPLSLDSDDLYKKIVTDRRGGYCFEINGFLGDVFRALGYEVTEYFARYLRGETDIPMRRHRVLKVICDGKPYLCDAGIGQSAFRLPLLIEDGAVSEQYGETYKIEKEPFLGWVVSDFHKGEWRKFYSFTEEEQLNVDFVAASFWCEKSPDSPFLGAEMFSIKTDTGRITLDGNVFHIFDGDNVTEKILTEDEMKKAYSEYFGLPYYEGLNLKRV